MNTISSNENTFWELVGKSLSGDASIEEQNLLDELITAHPDFRTQFEDIKRDHEIFNSYTSKMIVDTDAAWERQSSKIRKYELQRSGKSWLLAIAAVLTIFFVITGVLPDNGEVEVITAGERKTITLPDGSQATLNRNSKLTYGEDYGKKERSVTLSGEGFFEVTKNAAAPFVVATENDLITVLGTKFNVKTGEETEVYVTEGKVSFRALDTKEEVVLTKGQYARHEAEILRVEAENDPLLWKNRHLVFDQAPLSEVMRQLSIVYPITFKKSEVMEDCLHSGQYENVPLTTILTSLETIYTLQKEEIDGKMTVKFISCH